MEDKDVIHQRMMDEVDDEFDKTEGSFFYDLHKPTAIELENQNKKIDETKSKFDLENLSDEELENAIKDRSGIERKEATYSNGQVYIEGAIGSQISKGDLVASDNVNFISQENIILESESIYLEVKCEEPGQIGNVPVGAIKYFPKTISGISLVKNENAFTNGYEAETDESLLQRHYEKVRTPATSGNRRHYKNWAKEVTGVGSARVFSLWDGGGTVKVLILNQNKEIAAQTLIDSVQEYIDPGVTGTGDGTAPIGAKCTINTAVSNTINISLSPILDNSFDENVILQNVKDNINGYFKSISFEKDITGQTEEIHVIDNVSYAQIGKNILDSEGVLDYSNLLVNGDIINIDLQANEVPVLGDVIFNA